MLDLRAQLEAGLASRYTIGRELGIDPAFAPLRGNPRFDRMIGDRT